MNKKRIRITSTIIVLLFTSMIGLSACSKKENNESATRNNETESPTTINSTTEVTEESTEKVKVEYEDMETFFLIANKEKFENEYVDGERIKEGQDYSNPIWQDITINGEVTLYDIFKYEVGYTKSGIEGILIQTYGDWTFIDVLGKANTAYAVRTDELNKVMVVTTEDSATPEKESTSEKNEEENTNETTYSVVEMSATKYAKQSVNIRKGPGTDYEKIGSLTMNQKVTVTGQADNGWYRISYNGGDAYVSNKYLVDNKIEMNTNEATDNGGNSDNGGENNNGSDDTTNNSNTDNGNGGGNNTPTPEPETPAPTEPVVTRTPDEVLSMLDSAYRAAGFSKSTDVMTPEEIEMFGPTDGMGWGLRPISSGYTYEDALNDAKAEMNLGYTVYYLEYVETQSNGTIVIKIYNG